ncbi:NAD-dependent epimerase/dehydratase family protein [Tsuneonella sp. HG249]
MSVFLTGAGGFLGSAVLEVLREAEIPTTALFRPSGRGSAKSASLGMVQVLGDLRQPGRWQEPLSGATAVIHCAAAATGDLPTQLGGTVLATENLLAALPATLKRFIHVSSLSVYDFSAPGFGGRLDEKTPLEPRPLRRDAYTQTKLIQERMVRAHCRSKGIPLAIIRPGAIYSQPGDWDHGRALRMGPFDLIFAPLGSMRLVHVDDCARAIVAALGAEIEGELVLNLVGDEQPSHWGFHRLARKSGVETGIPVPIPYALVRLAGAAAALASRLFFGGRARLPEMLDLPRQQARWRPLKYSNMCAKTALRFAPRGGGDTDRIGP